MLKQNQAFVARTAYDYFNKDIDDDDDYNNNTDENNERNDDDDYDDDDGDDDGDNDNDDDEEEKVVGKDIDGAYHPKKKEAPYKRFASGRTSAT
ncbi:hypothetical protein ElyMa_005905700 [Elysia marginata]|uniref:Uncharacterized protein n=1 Tax=Elysia marginata TaxID=1093978 RepID=A0AAV4G6A0_9GAST|nr:hypothetical protein ElyMa_005905700 [Elysia marginata]